MGKKQNTYLMPFSTTGVNVKGVSCRLGHVGCPPGKLDSRIASPIGKVIEDKIPIGHQIPPIEPSEERGVNIWNQRINEVLTGLADLANWQGGSPLDWDRRGRGGRDPRSPAVLPAKCGRTHASSDWSGSSTVSRLSKAPSVDP